MSSSIRLAIISLRRRRRAAAFPAAKRPASPDSTKGAPDGEPYVPGGGLKAYLTLRQVKTARHQHDVKCRARTQRRLIVETHRIRRCRRCRSDAWLSFRTNHVKDVIRPPHCGCERPSSPDSAQTSNSQRRPKEATEKSNARASHGIIGRKIAGSRAPPCAAGCYASAHPKLSGNRLQTRRALSPSELK